MSKASSDFRHLPVLYAETLQALQIKSNGTYVDCTAGGGGHAGGIMKQLDSDGKLLLIDKDPDALKAASTHLDSLHIQATYQPIAADFRDLTQVLQNMGLAGVDGVLADLGVSSHQLDTDERGFAFRLNGPLDMRMNPQQELTAARLIENASQERLEKIFRDYGEERYAKAIAAAIVKRRSVEAFTETLDLAETISKAVPAAARREKHPAKRCFQALRIAVNDELGALESLLDQLPELLNDSARVCIITFHSLEDRIVKQRFRAWENPCICPKNIPCVCGLKALGKSIERRGYVAAATENEINPRARSARLRVFERHKGDGVE